MATERWIPWRGCQHREGHSRPWRHCWCLPPGPLAEDGDRWARFRAEIDARIAVERRRAALIARLADARRRIA